MLEMAAQLMLPTGDRLQSGERIPRPRKTLSGLDRRVNFSTLQTPVAGQRLLFRDRRVLGRATGAVRRRSAVPLILALGLLVEHVDGVREAGRFSPMGFPEQGSFNGCLAEQLGFEGQTVLLLAWRNLLLAEECRRLADFQSRTQKRLEQLEEVKP